MANKHGDFIWYELMARDPDRARAFYEALLGWTMGHPAPGGKDYQLIAAGDEFIGGVLRLTDAMCDRGAHPVWLGYVGVDDVDATITRLIGLGGSVLMPAEDLQGVGRLAMVADPQGTPFYVMRGAVEGGESRAFHMGAPGHCSWNELTTAQPQAALDFYAALFGWQSTDSMPMDAGREYRFLDHGDTRIGAITPVMDEGPTQAWSFYFQVPDIDRAVATIAVGGGQLAHGPHEIPGGEFIVIGSDPEGAMFALVGPRHASWIPAVPRVD